MYIYTDVIFSWLLYWNLVENALTFKLWYNRERKTLWHRYEMKFLNNPCVITKPWIKKCIIRSHILRIKSHEIPGYTDKLCYTWCILGVSKYNKHVHPQKIVSMPPGKNSSHVSLIYKQPNCKLKYHNALINTINAYTTYTFCNLNIQIT